MRIVKENLSCLYSKRRILAVIPFALSLFGCSTTTSSQWAEPDDHPGQWSMVDDSVNQWSKKIGSLPIELHGALPGQSSAATATLVPRAVVGADATLIQQNGIGLLASQRVVFYINEEEVPERSDYCALNKNYKKVPVEKNSVTLRAALCDGPRIVAYARKSVGSSEINNANIGREVADVEHSLTGALYPAFDFLRADD